MTRTWRGLAVAGLVAASLVTAPTAASASQAHVADQQPFRAMCEQGGGTFYSGAPGVSCHVRVADGGLDEALVVRLSRVCVARWDGTVERTVYGDDQFADDALNCWKA